MDAPEQSLAGRFTAMPVCLRQSGRASASAAFSCLILSGTTLQEKHAAM
jgi:hypothetical protein